MCGLSRLAELLQKIILIFENCERIRKTFNLQSELKFFISDLKIIIICSDALNEGIFIKNDLLDIIL